MKSMREVSYIIIYAAVILFSLNGISFADEAAIPAPNELPVLADASGAQVDINQATNSMTITAQSASSVLNFSSFNIGSNALVNIVMPSAESRMFNRVTGSSTSSIFGGINCNQGLWVLVNTNGIYFAPTARVNVDNMIASTLDISTNNFLNGNYLFEHQGSNYAQLLNEGTIEGNNIALMGSAVTNTGIVLARAGSVHLASGDKTTVSFDRRGLVSIEVNENTSGQVLDLNGNTVEDAVANSGSVQGVTVVMTAQTASNIFKNAVNLSGIVKATQVVEEEGVIRIVSNKNINVSAEFKTEGNTILSANEDINVNADLTVENGNLDLLADSDLDGVGAFYQAKDTTISTINYGDITIQASGASTLANINSAGSLILKQGGLAVTYNQLQDSIITTYGSLTINPGVTLNAANTNYNIGKDWINAGVFNPQISKVSLVSSQDALVRGNNTFYNFSITEPGKIVKFESESTQAILNNLTFRGEYGNLLTLTSIDPTKQWSINPLGQTDIQYSLISNLNNIRGPPLKALHTSSLGNNTNLDLDPFWTGNGPTSNWSDPDNWDTGTTPTAFDTVTFDGITGTNPNKNSFIDAAFQGSIDNLTLNGYTGILTLQRDLIIFGDLNISSGLIKGLNYPLLTVNGSLSFISEGYTYFGYNQQGGDSAFSVNLNGDLTIDNPNVWIYSGINFIGSSDQSLSYLRGTIYGKITVNKSSGSLNWNGSLNLARLPLYFIPNYGQLLDQNIEFYALSSNSLLYFTSQGVYNFFRESVVGEEGVYRWLPLRLEFIGASPSPKIVADLESEAKFNYLLGSDPSQQHTAIPGYFRLTYQQLYSGINLSYSSKQGLLESEFIISPSANYQNIRLGYADSQTLSIDSQGNLIVTASGGQQLKELRPYAYQEIDGQIREVAANYTLLSADSYGFAVEGYDSRYPLIIDPTTLSYSTFLGASGNDYGYSIAIDTSGNAYITGVTVDVVTDFPTTIGAYDTTHNAGTNDVFITKINSTGTGLVYSTFLGGSGSDLSWSIAVDTSGNAYVAGYTASTNFPTTAGAYDTSSNGSNDIFITKINAAGDALLYSTYIGASGSDVVTGSNCLTIDTSGNIYATGWTADVATDFPTTAGAYDTTHNGGTNDYVVFKLNPAGAGAADLVYSTFLGGTGDDSARSGVAVDASGNIYFAGQTASTDFPTLNQYQTNQADSDAVVLKLNPAAGGAADLLYSTYLGGGGTDGPWGIAVDTSGNIYVGGYTFSSNFPVKNAYQSTAGSSLDAWLAKINPASSGADSLIYSTYFGGNGNDSCRSSVFVDSLSNLYFSGYTASTNLPTTVNAYDTTHSGSGSDAYVAKLNPTGNGLLYSTYLSESGTSQGTDVAWGITVDSTGNIYITGETASSNFPVTSGAYDTTHNGGIDAFVAKLHPALTWDGSTDTGWATAANWDTGYVPDSTDDVVIADVTNDPALNANRTTNNLTINSGAVLSLGGYNLTVTGNFDNSGTLQLRGSETVSITGTTTHNSGSTITYTGDGDSAADTYTLINWNYQNLTVNSTDATTDTFQLGAALDVNGAFRLQAGTLNCNSQTQTYAGNFQLDAGTTFTKGGAITFDGTSAATYTDSTAGVQNIGAVTIGKTSGTAADNKLTLASSLKVDTLTINANNTLDLASSGYTLTLSNAGSTATVFTNNGTLTPGTSTVKYSATNSAGNVNVTTTTYNSLQLSGVETYDLTGNLTGTNAMTGNLTIDSGATLDTTSANSYGITLAGNWANSGTFTPNANTVTFDGSGTSTLSGSTTFYDLASATAGKTLTLTRGSTQTVTHDLTLTGTAANPIIINDTGAGAIPKFTLNSGATQSINNVNVTNNDASAGLQLVARSTSSLSGTTTNWVLGSSGTTFTWTGSVSTDWNTAGNWDLGTVPSTTDTVVIPSTANQPTLAAATTIVSLTINSGATLSTGNNALTITSNFTLNGTLTASTSTVTINGNLTGSGTIGGTTLNVTVTGYAGTQSNPINTNVTGTLTLSASGMQDMTSISVKGTGTYTFSGSIPGFVFVDNRLVDSLGQSSIRGSLEQGTSNLYMPRFTQSMAIPLVGMSMAPMPMAFGGAMPMPAVMMAPAIMPIAAPVAVPIAVPQVISMPAPVAVPHSIASEGLLPTAIAPEAFSGAGAHVNLPQVSTQATFLGNTVEINLPEPLFRGISTSSNLPVPITSNEFRGIQVQTNLPQLIIAPKFEGITLESVLPIVTTPETFIGAGVQTMLPQVATVETFLGNTAEVNLPEPLFKNITTSGNLPIPVIPEEFQGSLAQADLPQILFKGITTSGNLPQPTIQPVFAGITPNMNLPTAEPLIIREIGEGTKVELMFPSGYGLIPTYGLGIPFGVEGPVMDTEIRLKKVKEE